MTCRRSDTVTSRVVQSCPVPAAPGRVYAVSRLLSVATNLHSPTRCTAHRRRSIPEEWGEGAGASVSGGVG